MYAVGSPKKTHHLYWLFNCCLCGCRPLAMHTFVWDLGSFVSAQSTFVLDYQKIHILFVRGVIETRTSRKIDYDNFYGISWRGAFSWWCFLVQADNYPLKIFWHCRIARQERPRAQKGEYLKTCWTSNAHRTLYIKFLAGFGHGYWLLLGWGRGRVGGKSLKDVKKGWPKFNFFVNGMASLERDSAKPILWIVICGSICMYIWKIACRYGAPIDSIFDIFDKFASSAIASGKSRHFIGCDFGT